MRDLERQTRRTDVLNSRVIAAFCLASSQMMIYEAIRLVLSLVKEQSSYVILREFGIPATAHQSKIVVATKQFCHAYPSVEVCAK